MFLVKWKFDLNSETKELIANDYDELKAISQRIKDVGCILVSIESTTKSTKWVDNH